MAVVTPEMMEVIKNFTQITNSGVVFPVGNQIVVADGGGIGVDRSAGRTIVATATLTNPIEVEFAVDDCIQLYSALAMYEQPEISVDPEIQKIIVTGKGDSGKFMLNMASPDVVKAPGQIKFPEDPLNTTFRLTAAMYQRVFKGIGIVQQPEVIMYGQNGELFIAAYDQRNKQSNTFVISIGDTDATFSVVVKVDSLNKLLKSTDYNVTIAPAGIMRATSAGGPISIEYMIAGQYKQ